MVWNEIKNSKRKTITYKELAIKIGKPKAYRAASACAKNFIKVIPCHRVIATVKWVDIEVKKE